MLQQQNPVIEMWPDIKGFISVAHSEEEYNRQVSFLDDLLDEVGEDESHPLASLVETVGSLVEAYESATLPEPEGSPAEILRYLMQEHNLGQKDLPEVGSQGVVSEIVNGRRNLNIRQVKALGKKFGVAPAIFL